MGRKLKKNIRSAISRGFSSALLLIAALAFVAMTGAQWAGAFSNDKYQVAALLPFSERVINNANPQLFAEPLLSVTCDDGWKANCTVAAPLLEEYGIHSTQFLLAGTWNDPGYMSLNQMKALAQSGREIACHSVTNQDLKKHNDKQLDNEITGFQKKIKDYCNGIQDFAAPHGHYNNYVIDQVNKTYISHHNNDGGITYAIKDAG